MIRALLKSIRSLLKPLPALVAALLAILLAVLYLDRGWTWPVVIVAGAAVLIAVAYAIGLQAFKRWPHTAGFFVEAGLGLLTLGAAVAGALLLWLAIEKAPGDKASTREKEVWAALSAAVAAYLGSVIIKPEGDLWNPVKDAIRKVFKDRFEEGVGHSDLESDAHRAVVFDWYGAKAASHTGDQVEGWDWDARRTRTRHIQDYLASLRSARSV